MKTGIIDSDHSVAAFSIRYMMLGKDVEIMLDIEADLAE